MAILNIKSILIGIISVLLGSTLIANSSETPSLAKDLPSPENQIQGIILPHHLLVKNYMEDFYKLVGENRPDITRVILVAPNHFLYGFHYIQSTDQEFTKKNSSPLDQDFIENLSQKTALGIEPKDFEKEHGIMAELPFIYEHFPKAKIVPIILKSNIPQDRLDSLINEINKADLTHTLIIASIDFSHYESEEISVENDNRTMTWLKKWGEKDQKETFNSIKGLAKSPGAVTRSAVAIDSPESLYVITKVMENLSAKTATLWKRTSSASLMNVKDPLQNTSHLFIIFNQ
jgi:AmmeMemoRadiSam system protein B